MARPREFQEEEVLEKALDLFWHKGYEATSVQDLVNHMGISRGSLYDTFGDKHSLFLRVLDRYKQNSHQRFRAIFDQAIYNQNVTVKAAIRRFLMNIVDEAMLSSQNRGCLMTNSTVELAPHDPDTADRTKLHRETIEEIFYEALVHGQKTGEISTETEARAIAQFLFMTIQGLRVVTKTTSDRKALENMVTTALSVI